MPESHPSQPSNPETLQPHQTMIGLQGRLLLRDQTYLNPEKHCTPDSIQSIATFDERSYTPFENRSQQERNDYWQTRTEKKFDARYDAWSTGLIQSLNTPTNEGHRKNLQSIFTQADIAQGETFTKEDAQKLYARYFKKHQNPEQLTGIKMFVKDALMAHVQHGNTIDTQTLQNNLTSIQWFSKIFGETSSELVTQLIEAETRPYTDAELPKKLTATTNNVMRINDLTEKEQELLKFIAYHETAKKPQTENRKTNELPIMRFKQEIQKHIMENDFTIVIGGTGCGKTLKVPQFVLEIMKEGDKLAVAEPTQINTSKLAGDIGREIHGAIPGKKVGFHHGGNKDLDDENDIVVMTEGILFRKLLHDPLLKEYSHVLADEIHVRNKQGEQMLELLIRAQKLRKEKGMKPLKIIGTSATANKKELQKYFDGASPIEIPGQPAEIQDIFSARDIPQGELRKAAVEKIAEILRSADSGDIECFVKGVADIEGIEKMLAALSLEGIKIIPFHRNSTEEEKNQASEIAKEGERRIFLATRFGQTGLTINGLKHVIISGEDYENNIDPRTGLESLRIVPQSHAEILQCRGRVGRNQAGTCHYLFTEAEFRRREENQKYPEPEMKRSDITDVVLGLRKSGRQNIHDAKFLSSPLTQESIDQADKTLTLLGANNPDKTLNAIGERMAELPIDYHLARMIAEAERRKIGIRQACEIAGLVENSRGIFSRNKNKAAQAMQVFKVDGSDFLTYLSIWHAFLDNKTNRAWAQEQGLDYDGLMKAGETINKLLTTAKNRSLSNRAPTQEELEQIIFTGYQDMVMEYDQQTKSYRWERENIPPIQLSIDRNSALSGTTPKYVIARNISPIRPGENRAFLTNCQQIEKDWANADELPIAA